MQINYSAHCIEQHIHAFKIVITKGIQYCVDYITNNLQLMPLFISTGQIWEF